MHIYTAADTIKLFDRRWFLHISSQYLHQTSLDYFCARLRVPTQQHSQHNTLKLYMHKVQKTIHIFTRYKYKYFPTLDWTPEQTKEMLLYICHKSFVKQEDIKHY